MIRAASNSIDPARKAFCHPTCIFPVFFLNFPLPTEVGQDATLEDASSSDRFILRRLTEKEVMILA
ncbi:hypothetical protein HJG54_25060 [Leptolyngbya sp. NK1-12]|uniref:Uncharacterized protein n=1 Tax=Leptolyngbya sp. NK1-12 TaxID=2547451 RepID=A0AA96WX30_9CYAN|nr:hypothetical protein [Leptolyngbya sp. NK1-12]WNZ25782.1 hypothetical protein HJG54_25060 [Leptolyngbya sp. NK1-12]